MVGPRGVSGVPRARCSGNVGDALFEGTDMRLVVPTATAVRRRLSDSVFGKFALAAATSMAFSVVPGLADHPDLPTPAPPPAAPATPRPRDDVATQQRIQHCQSRGPQVWLTFDDGGSVRQVHRILRVLAARHVRAIFFPIGSWAHGHPGLVREIAAAGHVVGDHTRDHVDLATVSDQRARWEIRHGLPDAVPGSSATPLLRPPFGAGAYTTRLRDLAEQTGVRLCTWTVDTRDWTGSSAATIIRRVARGDAASPRVRAGGVVIMHMNGDHTGAALPGVIRAVRAHGLALHRLP